MSNRKPLILLINDFVTDHWRVAPDGNPVGNYGQTEHCMKCTATKAEMLDHLKKMKSGGHRITRLVRELNEICM